VAPVRGETADKGGSAHIDDVAPEAQGRLTVGVYDLEESHPAGRKEILDHCAAAPRAR